MLWPFKQWLYFNFCESFHIRNHTYAQSERSSLHCVHAFKSTPNIEHTSNCVAATSVSHRTIESLILLFIIKYNYVFLIFICRFFHTFFSSMFVLLIWVCFQLKPIFTANVLVFGQFFSYVSLSLSFSLSFSFFELVLRIFSINFVGGSKAFFVARCLHSRFELVSLSVVFVLSLCVSVVVVVFVFVVAILTGLLSTWPPMVCIGLAIVVTAYFDIIHTVSII